MKLEHIQQVTDPHPVFNWLIIVGTAVLSWVQPIAGLVAIVWGCLQIYSWVEKRRRRS